jgi:hypothetical protein
MPAAVSKHASASLRAAWASGGRGQAGNLVARLGQRRGGDGGQEPMAFFLGILGGREPARHHDELT